MYLVVFNQWLMMRFYFIIMCFYLKALFCYPLIPITPQSFPMIFIHFFQTLNFLSNPKNFKQTLSIACL
ncbi:hypothetical protein B0X34_05960 [Helicobacter pylori]|nr:hypothetical protein B0X34_05960 [Helicobacter pylori]